MTLFYFIFFKLRLFEFFLSHSLSWKKKKTFRRFAVEMLIISFPRREWWFMCRYAEGRKLRFKIDVLEIVITDFFSLFLALSVHCDSSQTGRKMSAVFRNVDAKLRLGYGRRSFKLQFFFLSPLLSIRKVYTPGNKAGSRIIIFFSVELQGCQLGSFRRKKKLQKTEP